MKSKILVLLSLLYVHQLSAQLAITQGTQVSIAGNITLTLQNSDFINNGNFEAGNSTISFTGNAGSSISGGQPVRFTALEIKKESNTSVLLQRDINVSQRIVFGSGFLNLNGFNTVLASTGLLEGENENSRIIGAAGGVVMITVAANANPPALLNPGNLGVLISSTQNPGALLIKRGHRSQNISPAPGRSILRYYEISPDNNTNLGATLRFNYFNAELNGLDEDKLDFFESPDNITWTNLGSSLRNTGANFSERNGIGSFKRFTLSDPAATTLPVNFILFNANCQGNKVLLSWKTAQETNSHHFSVERSANGVDWNSIGQKTAAGNSTGERSYSFTDNSPSQDNFYRVAEVDIDGRIQYSGIIHSSCTTADMFRLWPNPVRNTVFINITTATESAALIRIFDSKGALVRSQKANLLQGSNQLNIDMVPMANGVYTISVTWNKGQMIRTEQVMKQ